jgi:hypothetical protein
VSRNNPESEWIIQDVPELRIIDQDFWKAVKAQQQKLAYAAPAPGEIADYQRRPSGVHHPRPGLKLLGERYPLLVDRT